GSCLGPVLFSIYTSDLADTIRFGSLHSYADDCQLLLPYPSSQAKTALKKINND
ncbi:hypothetical protein J6590_059662, partial [Homalodisca vitripennis]